MRMEQTLSIIKPDGVKKNVIGEVILRFEKAGMRVAAIKMTTLTRRQAEAFYVVHKERPFYQSLVDFMVSGPLVLMILEGKDAIKKVREIMGATNPAEAAEGTIRKDFADSIEANVVHGSDATDTAAYETSYFFSVFETFNRG
ncbi:MAG: nucleoside-diphosphate kinase [Deltaproteobacteria bacterium]|nr:nucleoside-diphosphate kinase [Deltaproteobacteria bacterium]